MSRSWLGPLLEEGGHAVDDFGEGDARAEASESFEFVDAGDAAHHVFEPRLVGFVVGNEFDGGRAVGALLHELREASMETSSVLPTFTTSPTECSVSIRRTRDSTVSRTSQKQRDCLPSP